MVTNNEVFLENIDTNLLPVDNDAFEVTTLIEEYKLATDASLINSAENQYKILTEFITTLYLEKKELPQNIKVFIQRSFNYKLYLLKNIENRMKNIIAKNSINIFKEIYILLNLLSNGNSYNLLDEKNRFSIENLQLLLTDYENRVCEQFLQNDKENFELTFQLYLSLLELLNEICIINSIDIQRRKNINNILELIKSTIVNTKNKINLDDKYSNTLNMLLGKLLLYFTDMTYVPIDMNNQIIVMQKYSFMLQKIYDGYELLGKDSKYYITFFDKLTTLILTLIYKLKSKLQIKNLKFSDSKELLEIYEYYNKYVKTSHKIECDNLNDFRDNLLLNYKTIYVSSTNSLIDEDMDLIEYFIALDEISNLHMLLIHNIVLYSGDISKERLDKLALSLLKKNRYDNDYYEFYKLKILDRILQKYISLKIETSKNELISNIIEYIERNNLISHLMSMYSKIYLSLSLYYSYEKANVSQEKSKEFYFIYQRLDNNNFLEKEFFSISKQILFNYGRNYFSSLNLKSQVGSSNMQLIQIGKDLINSYISKKDLEIENQSFVDIEKLMKRILEIKEPDDKWLNDEIESLIINKIFFGLVKAKISNTHEPLNKIEVGYDLINIELSNEYVLKLFYSSYYKNAVKKLLDVKKEFIELVVDNILKSYINSIPSFTDVITKLPNINKLKVVLKELDKKEIVFFEVYLNSLVNFSECNNVKASNEFFKAITDKINEEYNSFRLFGPKIGFILKDDEDYKKAVEFLQNLTIQFGNETFQLSPTIAVCEGKAYSILDKSFYALSSAKMAKNNLYFYK